MVSFKYLDNLASLQVPYVGFVVLTPRDDPLAACHTEAGGDTVLRVRMSSVGFETPRCLIVPQADRTVMSRGEDVFGIRGELDMLTG